MKQRDLFAATVAHEPHDPYLFYANFTPAADEKLRRAYGLAQTVDLRKTFNMYDPAEVSPQPPPDLVTPDFQHYFADMDIPSGAFINRLGVLEIPGSLYHFTHYVSPLRHAERLEEILDFPYPSVDGYLVDHMAEAARQAKAAGRVTCCHLVHMYEDAWQIRGYEPFLMDMLTNPEICAYILDQIADKNLKKAEAAARAGVDVLISGDDVANQRSLMFAPELWRRFIKERWARVYAAARAIKPDIQIWYHSDGNIMSILPELIEIGVTILNPVQPECMDLAAVKRLYGQQLVLDGTIGTQTTFPFGTPQDIRAVIQDRIENLGADGALMLSPTHVLEPEVPLENMLAFLEACQQK